MKKKTLYWTVAVGLQMAVALTNSLCIYAAALSSETGPGVAYSSTTGSQLSDNSQQLAGWNYVGNHWYFYHAAEGETAMKCLTGWQWIDGYCYYFTPDGIMLAGLVTPDGYLVSESGAWLQDGIVVFYPGTGILTRPAGVTSGMMQHSGKSGSGGSSGRGSSGGSSSGGRGGSSSGGSSSGGSSGGRETGAGAPPEQPSSGQEDDSDASLYSYNIQYVDIETQTVLMTIAGVDEKGSSIAIEHFLFDNYLICDAQPETVRLTYDNLQESVYYIKVTEATPGDAEEIPWQVRFVDAETNQIQLLPMRSGSIPEGGSLSINYMRYLTVGNTIWEAVAEPPMEFEVYGPGHQLYYVQFEPYGAVETEPDPFAEAKSELKQYLQQARAYESLLTGELESQIPDSRFIITDKSSNDVRIGTIISQVSEGRESVYYVIGKNYKPDGILIVEWFGQEWDAEYSSVTEAEIQIGQDVYTIVRMSVTLQPDTDTCIHLWVEGREHPADCTGSGSQFYTCSRCDMERKVILPAQGHLDHDSDLICDRCGEAAETSAQPGYHWKLGDIQALELDGETYFFQCVDTNYTDESANHRQTALFLCTDIIPADYGSQYRYEQQPDGTYDYVYYPGEIVSFGSNNDYKYSNIRKFLKRLERNTHNLSNTNIGISYAYQGMTNMHTYEQFFTDALTPAYIGNQKMIDSLFILSVDEALNYRDMLWNVEETGPYAKGYWLRSPMGSSNAYDTDYVYIVDLVNGNIRPQHITAGDSREAELQDGQDTIGTTGIRPAFTMPQE